MKRRSLLTSALGTLGIAALGAGGVHAARARRKAQAYEKLGDLLTVQDLLLDGELTLARAERTIGPLLRDQKEEQLLQCDVSGSPFSKAALELEVNGEISGAQLWLREPKRIRWDLLLEFMGDDPQTEPFALCRIGPKPWELAASRGKYLGGVTVYLAAGTTYTYEENIDAQVPISANVIASTIRRADLGLVWARSILRDARRVVDEQRQRL